MATDGVTSRERPTRTDALATRSGPETDAYVSPLVDFLLVLSVVVPVAVGSVALITP